MFGPHRGAPPADTDALAELMVRLSQFAADHADDIAEIDLNPVIVHARGQGVSVVDALIVKRSATPSAAPPPNKGQTPWARSRISRVEKTGHVALVEIRRPPNNFFDIALIQEIAGALRGARPTMRNAAPSCWPRKARRSAPAPISATAACSTKTASASTAISRSNIFISRATGCSAPASRSSPRCTAPRSAAAWVWRWWRISASPARRRALPPISRGSVSIPASA